MYYLISLASEKPISQDMPKQLKTRRRFKKQEDMSVQRSQYFFQFVSSHQRLEYEIKFSDEYVIIQKNRKGRIFFCRILTEVVPHPVSVRITPCPVRESDNWSALTLSPNEKSLETIKMPMSFLIVLLLQSSCHFRQSTS